MIFAIKKVKFLLNLGENLCESNIGNLSIKLKKYDKAIFHLSQSIKFTRSTDLISNKSLIHIKNNHKITRFSSRTCKIYINILAIHIILLLFYHWAPSHLLELTKILKIGKE